MSFLHWFRTTRARLVEAGDLLEEAREKAVDLAGLLGRTMHECDRLREELAQREIECRKAWQISAIPAASRGEVLVERARADALEARLATLQEANMRRDV